MNKSRIIVPLLAVTFLGYVAYNNFSIPNLSSVFSIESIYRGGTKQLKIDPKEYFSLINGIDINTEDTCRVTIEYSASKYKIKDTGYYFPAEVTSNKPNEKELKKLLGEQGEGLYKEGDKIIMPSSNGMLRNSNVTNSTLQSVSNMSRHDIEISVGTDYIIVFKDVVTWWCHLHNPSTSAKHNILVGKVSNSINPSAGGTLGIAKSSTTVEVYKRKVKSDIPIANDVNISYADLEKISASEFFFFGID